MKGIMSIKGEQKIGKAEKNTNNNENWRMTS